jgi:hypothetical protein
MVKCAKIVRAGWSGHRCDHRIQRGGYGDYSAAHNEEARCSNQHTRCTVDRTTIVRKRVHAHNEGAHCSNQCTGRATDSMVTVFWLCIMKELSVQINALDG